MRKPTNPHKPYEPAPPAEKYPHEKIIDLSPYGDSSKGNKLVNYLPEDVKLEDILIGTSNDCDCSEYQYLYTTELVNNPYYKQQMKAYEVQLSQYRIALEKYNILKAQYDIDIAKYNKTSKESELRALKKRIKELQKS